MLGFFPFGWSLISSRFALQWIDSTWQTAHGDSRKPRSPHGGLLVKGAHCTCQKKMDWLEIRSHRSELGWVCMGCHLSSGWLASGGMQYAHTWMDGRLKWMPNLGRTERMIYLSGIEATRYRNTSPFQLTGSNNIRPLSVP